MGTMQLQFHSICPAHHDEEEGGAWRHAPCDISMVSHYECLNWSELTHASSGLSVWDNALWENVSRFVASLVHHLMQRIKNYLPFLFNVSLKYTDAI